MKTLTPPAVYITEAVARCAAAKRRAERLLARIETPRVETVSDADLDRLIAEHGWKEWRRLSGRQRHGDPPMVLDVFRFPPPDWPPDQPLPRAHRDPLVRTLAPPSHRIDGADQGIVCQDHYEFNTGYGCLFKCDYCYLEHILALNLNLEEFLEHLDPIVRAEPGPALWKWDNQTDTLCFEPEMGAVKLFVEYFSRFKDRFLMTYSKSDNVDHMLDLDHRGQTICCWTLNADTQSRLIERDAATMEQRIEAARKCEAAGYRVRFRFSAICPVRNWREENRRMLDLVFAKTHPDVITLETLSRMPDRSMFDKTMNPGLFEPRFLEAIRRGSPEIEGKVWGPIPDREREEIYRFFIAEIRQRSPETPISLCQEPRTMWQRLADALTMPPAHYACTCCRDSVPGGHPAIRPAG